MSNQSESKLNHEQACEVLYTFGADAARWPDAVREDIQERLKDDTALALLLDELRALDGLLDELPVEPPSLTLQTRILRSRTQDVAKPVWQSLLSLLWPYGSVAVPAGALMASAIMGGVVGVMANAGGSTTLETDEYQVVAFALGESFIQEESP